ncbi:MAG: GIY-YIG nuclease family protein [Planctomycetes bacterium]|nr:GIY-YIG nuclease family protein [Planctomycetota bacterium]
MSAARVRVGTRRRRWSIYLVRTADGALYTGIALDVAARFAAHADGRGAKALRGRGPLTLAFARVVGPHGASLRLEARVKRLAKADKERLVVAGLPRGWLAACRSTAAARP